MLKVWGILISSPQRCHPKEKVTDVLCSSGEWSRRQQDQKLLGTKELDL